MGCVLSAGLGQAPARQASIGAGIPPSVGATTVNKVCGSSLMTVIMAARTIGMGEARIVVAGGMESMTRAPYLLEKARQGYRLGHGELTDSLVKDGLWDVYNNFHMGNAGELCAAKYKIKRVLKLTGLSIKDLELFEINEAFSSVSLAINRELGLDPAKVNVNGGAVALGHPIGATGARILTTLLYAMEARGARRGLASLCIGGGEALAMVVERVP